MTYHFFLLSCPMCQSHQNPQDGDQAVGRDQAEREWSLQAGIIRDGGTCSKKFTHSQLVSVYA